MSVYSKTIFTFLSTYRGVTLVRGPRDIQDLGSIIFTLAPDPFGVAAFRQQTRRSNLQSIPETGQHRISASVSIIYPKYQNYKIKMVLSFNT